MSWYFKLIHLEIIALNVDLRQFSLTYYNKSYLKKRKNIIIFSINLAEDGFLLQLHKLFNTFYREI